ncbi:MAG: anti-sigma factor RsiW [Candidatus Krumholzibacteriia bacterium]|jgi:anti-sigma factor RsiW
MNGDNKNSKDQTRPVDPDGQSLSCTDCQTGLQGYLDGTLEKKQSLRFFLHLRDCEACEQSHVELKSLFAMLDNLPQHEVPADFNDAILASVPYASYLAMEPLRRQRVPVYLEEHFLPAAVRSRVTRWAGLGLSAAAVSAMIVWDGPAWTPAAVIAGVIPELLVQMQGLGRRVIALGRAEG